MLLRRVVAEALGTALLLAAVVGSGIMAEELARPNVALALLANTVAIGAALVALIITFGPKRVIALLQREGWARA
jgi:glycerol uptake facilitator-like aquaporin